MAKKIVMPALSNLDYSVLDALNFKIPKAVEFRKILFRSSHTLNEFSLYDYGRNFNHACHKHILFLEMCAYYISRGKKRIHCIYFST